MVSGPSSAMAEKLVISNWDGYMPKDMAEKFKAATGIELEIAVHATNEEIMGKVNASGGEEYDVLFVSSPFAEAFNNLGLVSPIDHSVPIRLTHTPTKQDSARAGARFPEAVCCATDRINGGRAWTERMGWNRV
jgi:maltose-binding protein MalE